MEQTTQTAVRIESPFPRSAWPRVWSWVADFRARVADDFAPSTLEEFVAAQMELAVRQKTWAVYRDDELCGLVSFEPMNVVTGLSHALFRRDFWGRDTTRIALRMVYAEIFANGVNKIVGTPFRDNHAMRSLAVSLGARNDGILREHTKRGGVFVDMVLLGLTKGDFEKCLS
jgi:RimJ/RimL family protein N-acetyltransferase